MQALSPAYMRTLCDSFSAGRTGVGEPLGLPEPPRRAKGESRLHLVWPTVDQVRCAGPQALHPDCRSMCQLAPEPALAQLLAVPRHSACRGHARACRESIEGWMAGVSIPGSQKTVKANCLKGTLHRWCGGPIAREGLHAPHQDLLQVGLPGATTVQGCM